jgi:hypothetical protein
MGKIDTFIVLFYSYVKMKVQKNLFSSVFNQKLAIVLFMAMICVMCNLQAQTLQKECDIRLNATVSSSGNLSNDGKGAYYTGKDWVGIWLNPTRWPDQSFHICMNWPFNYFKTCDSATAPAPTGTRENRTLLHQMTNPVPHGGGKSLGVFTGPGGGNDIALSKPLTSTVNGFTDMAIGTSLSPLSAEVRFSNSDGTEYYSLLFGDSSVWGYPNINGAGSTRPIVSRTSETTWTISFPQGAVGRLWNRAPKVPTSELYYYEGSLVIQKQ